MSSGDEDWFEKALREAEEAEDGAATSDEDGASGEAADGESDGHAADAGDTPEESAEDPFGGPSDDGSFGDGSDPFDGESFDADGDENPFGGTQDADDASGDPFGGTQDAEDAEDDPFGGTQETDDTDDDPFGGTKDGDDDPLGGTQDGDDASDDPFGGVRSPEGETGSFGGMSGRGPVGEEPFGGARGEVSGDGPFGGVQDGDGEDPFGGVQDGDTNGDPFGGVQGGNDGENPFGESFEAAMGTVGGDDFDEEEFDSAIERIDMGVEGLDDMILGGVPVRSLITVIGSAGTGKTTFGLQFLNQALAQGGRCVYITLEETEESIISSAEEKGWPFSEYVEEGSLVVVSMDPIEMANSLDSIRGELTRLINEFGADRVVLDSVSLLEMMYDDAASRRSEVFDFARSLKRAGVTTMLTSEANADNPFQSRHGLVEYLVDAVFILRYVRPSDFQETRLAVEIQKIRDANHSRETKPYDITDDGIDVYRQANIF